MRLVVLLEVVGGVLLCLLGYCGGSVGLGIAFGNALRTTVGVLA